MDMLLVILAVYFSCGAVQLYFEIVQSPAPLDTPIKRFLQVLFTPVTLVFVAVLILCVLIENLFSRKGK